jgi:microcystin-dependent protein
MTTRSTDPASYGAGIASLGTNTLPTTWEHPISWDSLEKYFKGALNKDTRKVFNMLLENSKSLEDHLDTAYLKNSGGTVAGSTTFTGSVTLPGTISLGGTLISTLSFPPTGSIMPYAGSAAPPGWLLCDGTPYSTTTYAALFTVCGSTYNTSAGQSAPTAGNFRVPNLKGRMPVGLDAGVTDFNTPGKSGGSTTVTITVAQLPVHKHANTAALTSGTVSITDPGHGHTITDPGHGHTINDHTHTNQVTTIIPAGAHAHDNVTDYVSAGTNGASPSPTVSSISTTSLSANSNTTGVSAVSNTTGISGSVGTGITVTNVDTGSGNAVDNMSPYLVLNYIIKT